MMLLGVFEVLPFPPLLVVRVSAVFTKPNKKGERLLRLLLGTEEKERVRRLCVRRVVYVQR